MATTIGGATPLSQLPARAAKATAGSGSRAQPGKPERQVPGEADNVQLTSSAARMRALAQELASEPPVNRIRIEALAQAIREGQYRLDPVQLAERFLSIEAPFGEDE
jgi:flagellar biosynthesis anti-sigma factor FlgM